jgi:hypothetical protein
MEPERVRHPLRELDLRDRTRAVVLAYGSGLKMHLRMAKTMST